MRVFIVSVIVLLSLNVSSQESNEIVKKKFIPNLKVFKSFDISTGIGGGMVASDKLSGMFSVGVDLNRIFKFGVSIGLSRFDSRNYLPVKFKLTHQWNFNKFFVYEEFGGGYTYSLKKPEQINSYNWYDTYSEKQNGGLSLEGGLGFGYALNDNVDLKMGASYSYQTLEEIRTYYNSSSSTKFDNYYNRYAVLVGLVFYN
tara:strand:- start:148 stop:747 length:600 start_codon:yes stop_codon:yes gene_type:complete